MFQASNEMMPLSEQDYALRSHVIARTLVSDAFRFLRTFHEKVAAAEFGEDARQFAPHLDKESYCFASSFKELSVAHLSLMQAEQSIRDEHWFLDLIKRAMSSLDELTISIPAEDISQSLQKKKNRKISSIASDSVLKSCGLSEAKKARAMKLFIQNYLEGSAELRSSYLQYALCQDQSILNDYIFTMQLFDD